jgi:DNA-binding response OmpR family regulator
MAFSEEEHQATNVILIVEDDVCIAEFLSLAISQETSYTPLVVTSGTHAHEVVQHIRPNLLILDYILGDMNGLELYDQLHAADDLQGLPALILSASSEKLQARMEQRQLPCLSKPLDLDIFLATITQLLYSQRSQSIESAPQFISSENGHQAPITRNDPG